MANNRGRIREDVHFRVMRLLQDNPEISQRDLARKVGISVGGTHYVLCALLEMGLIKFTNFTAAPDKRRYAYMLTPKGVAEKASMARRFLERKRREYDDLKEEIAALQLETGQESGDRGTSPPVRS
jgi:EPS-associated MarR family transcriptional regulator